MTISATTQGLRPGVTTSSNRPVTPFEGQMIYETDTDKVLVYDGTAWFVPYASAPLTVISRSTDQTITTATQSFVTMDTETVDVLNWHSTVTNTDRITPTIAGWYMCIGSGTYNTGFTGRVIFQLAKNGAEFVKFDQQNTGYISGASISKMVYLNGSTDYVSLATYQFSGSNQSFTAGALQLVLVRGD